MMIYVCWHCYFSAQDRRGAGIHHGDRNECHSTSLYSQGIPGPDCFGRFRWEARLWDQLLGQQRECVSASTFRFRRRDERAEIAGRHCLLVWLGRVELPTRSLGNCCSIHLSYSPTMLILPHLFPRHGALRSLARFTPIAFLARSLRCAMISPLRG